MVEVVPLLAFDCSKSLRKLLLELTPFSMFPRKFVIELLGVDRPFGGVMSSGLVIDRSKPFGKRRIATAKRLLNP